MGIFSFITKGENKKNIKGLENIANAVIALESKYASMSDAELKVQTDILKERLNKESLDDIMTDAFAVIREASARVLQMKHYKVQIMGGACLHQGRVAEMKTGEGKTLVETLPAYLNALTGKGVHIITVNDYLAHRDAMWMGKVYQFLGLTVGVNISGMTEDEKKAAYECDITYGTNNEFGFDYLRDNLKTSKAKKFKEVTRLQLWMKWTQSLLTKQEHHLLYLVKERSHLDFTPKSIHLFAVSIKMILNLTKKKNLST